MNYSVTVIRIQSVMQVTDIYIIIILIIKCLIKLLLKAQTTTGANGEGDGLW